MVLRQSAQGGYRLRVRKESESPRRLRAHVGVDVGRQRRERLAERGVLEPHGELGESAQPRRVTRREMPEQRLDDQRPAVPQHSGVVSLHGRRRRAQALERRGDEWGTLEPLERCDGRDMDGRVPIGEQPQQRLRVRRKAGDRQQAGALQPLPPAPGPVVATHPPRPPLPALRSLLHRPVLKAPRAIRQDGAEAARPLARRALADVPEALHARPSG